MLTHCDFPKDFVFGAATSSYQIEGQGFGRAGNTHWDSFAEQPGAISDGSNGVVACDHYHRYQNDLDFLKGFDAYRFSTSWARVLPDGKGAVNSQGLAFYDRLTDAILERGLQPHLTLYHWDLPEALALSGGWKNPDIANLFADYSDVVLDCIGDRMTSVATINEPWCVAWLSHFLGHHAPGETDIKSAASAMHNVLSAHSKALERMRLRGQNNLGIVLNFEHAQPLDNTQENLNAANRFDAIFNRWFIQAITTGTYPKAALVGLEEHLPSGWQTQMAGISKPIDWLGVNYYTRQLVADAPEQPWPSYQTSTGPLDKTQMGWEIYPQGLGKLLDRLKTDYVENMPIVVCENGMALDDNVVAGKVDDKLRWQFIQSHIAQIHDAIGLGVNVKGYLYWSLLDNFEWAFGYEKRFGLIHVDYETQKRTAKDSYQSYRSAFARQ